MIYHAQFSIVANDIGMLTIRDEGHWNISKTVTNDVEYIVKYLHAIGLLNSADGHKKRLLYYDSDNELGEIQHDGEGHFVGFSFFD